MSAKIETVTMTLGEIVAVYSSICGNGNHLGLNGYQKAVGEKIMVQPYSFTDETRQDITRNRFVLKPFIEGVEQAERERITCEVMEDPEAKFVPADDEAKQSAWFAAYRKACAVRHPVPGLRIFARSDLFRENRNPIPSDVETGLGPILEGSPWREFARKLPQGDTLPGGEPA